jgi:hypothetical protein
MKSRSEKNEKIIILSQFFSCFFLRQRLLCLFGDCGVCSKFFLRGSFPFFSFFISGLNYKNLFFSNEKTCSAFFPLWFYQETDPVLPSSHSDQVSLINEGAVSAGSFCVVLLTSKKQIIHFCIEKKGTRKIRKDFSYQAPDSFALVGDEDGCEKQKE